MHNVIHRHKKKGWVLIWRILVFLPKKNEKIFCKWGSAFIFAPAKKPDGGSVKGAISSVGLEHLVYTEGVGSSSLSSPTEKGVHSDSFLLLLSIG